MGFQKDVGDGVGDAGGDDNAVDGGNPGEGWKNS